MLRFFVLVVTLTSSAFALEDFPEKELREGHGQLFLVRIASELNQPDNPSGKGENFDAAKALASCDAVDKKLKEGFEARKKIFYEAKSLREKNDPNWDKNLREEIQFGGAAIDGVPLKKSIRDHLNNKWSCNFHTFMPCQDHDSFDRVSALAEDPALIDDPPFNTCVRLVKALRKSGECTYSQAVTDKTCNQVTGKDVVKATVIDDGKKQTVEQVRDGVAKPKITVPRPNQGE